MKKKILIADDDFDFLNQLQLTLQQWGYDVIAAETQREAETILAENKPDLAIYDLMMENQDSGFVLAYKTKKQYPDVPVLIITSVTHETGISFDVSTREMREWIYADAVLEKDIRPEQLQREMEHLLGG